MLGRGFFPQYAASQWAVQGRLPMSLCLTHLQKGGPRSTFLLKHWRWTLICCSVPCWFCWWYPPWWWSGPGISIVCSGSNYSQMWDQKGTPPSSPCPDQVTRAASHPARLLQAFHLTLCFYSLGDVLAFSCFLPAATHAKKKLMGLFRLVSAGFRHGNVLRLWKSLCLWPKGLPLVLCYEVPCIPQIL